VTDIKFNSYLPKYNNESTMTFNATVFVVRSKLVFGLHGTRSRHVFVWNW